MTRQRRQLDELHALCAAGDLTRAIDLAFEHLATFGGDEQVIDLLAREVERRDPEDRIRRRLGELAAGARAAAAARHQD